MLFGRWTTDVQVKDRSLKEVIDLRDIFPHTHGRHSKRYMGKTKVNIVERLANKLMRGGTGEKVSGKVIRTHGRLQGKKYTVLKIIYNAFEDIERKEKVNPVEMLVRAIENAAPREDITKVEIAGVRYQVAVDISSIRRVDVALRNIVLAAILKHWSSKRPLYEVLAEEIILAAKNDVQNSYALKKKDEIERVATSAR
ncbi:MAG: 30S ribosomal protein S7 [Candidatus Micrarchaeota archaeon]|nr:30S ribosomal protein S7 [Candidatus Micrarchaeota archaeon]MCX8154244.1 30S ribosomal protein S7 [Candidatus Micrarchaeota archaeon]